MLRRLLPNGRSQTLTFIRNSRILSGEQTELPREGIGHPEPLVGMNNITWSRRISAHDRIIYDIHDDIVTVIIIQVGNHYDDK